MFSCKSAKRHSGLTLASAYLVGIDMSDAAIVNATARREQLVADTARLAAEIDTAKKEIARIDTFIQEWKRFAGEDAGPLFEQDAPPAPPVVKAFKPKNPPKERIGNILRQYLLDRQMPASRKQMMQHLRSVGVNLEGTDPDMVLSTMLWRMQDRFVRIPKLGYWLVDQPYTPADYNPPAA